MKLVEMKDGKVPEMDHEHPIDARKAAILIFDRVQIIDFTAPYEVFGQAGFDVFTVEKQGKTVVTAMGMTVQPNYSFADSPEADIVVVPGGGITEVQKDPEILDWIRQRSAKAEKVLSVCNGAYILARADLLNGLEATTFAALIEGLQGIAPETRVVSNKRYVDNGKIVTSAGLSSGLDASLHVVAELLGLGRAQEIATNLEYNWDTEGEYVRALLPDKYLAGVNRKIRSFPGSKHLLHEGNVSHWEDRWSVELEASVKELQTRIQKIVQDQSGFQINTATSGSDETRWTFQDEQGRSWRGTVVVQAEPKSPRRSKVTLKIELTKQTAR